MTVDARHETQLPGRRERLCVAARRGVEFAVDLARVLALLPELEGARRREGPAPLLARLRARGRTQRARSEVSRAGLARAIRWVDRLSPGGANCYRRTLLRVALDCDAALEPIIFGFDVALGRGHAWVNGQEATDRFDVEFPI